MDKDKLKLTPSPPENAEPSGEPPLSPLLTKKRYVRKHPARKSTKRLNQDDHDQQEKSPGKTCKYPNSCIPVPVKDYKKHITTPTPKHQPNPPQPDSQPTSSSSLTNFKEEVITNCAKSSKLIKIETPIKSKPLSISESKLTKPGYSNCHEEAKNSASSPTRCSKPCRYPKKTEAKCASGDNSEESTDVDFIKEQQRSTNLDMLYENSKFESGQFSKTTVIGSIDSDEIGSMKVFCNNNFQSTDSSGDSFMKPATAISTYLKSPKSPECIIQEEDPSDKELKSSQLNYNEATDNESVKTVTNCFDNAYKSYRSTLTSNITAKTKTKDGNQNNPFLGFSDEEVQDSTKDLEQFRSTFEALMQNEKKADYEVNMCEMTAIRGSPIKMMGSLSIKDRTKHSLKTSNKIIINGVEAGRCDKAIAIKPNNRVQICIGHNNRIKIDIKTEGHVGGAKHLPAIENIPSSEKTIEIAGNEEAQKPELDSCDMPSSGFKSMSMQKSEILTIAPITNNEFCFSSPCSFAPASAKIAKVKPDYLQHNVSENFRINLESDTTSKSPFKDSVNEQLKGSRVSTPTSFISSELDCNKSGNSGTTKGDLLNRKILKPKSIMKKYLESAQSFSPKTNSRKSLCFTDESRENADEFGKVPNDLFGFKSGSGFSTASGKTVEINKDRLKSMSAMFKDIDNEFNSKTVTGFSNVSGKNFGINKDKLNGSSNIFKDIDSNVTSNTGSGFSTASGKKFNVNKDRLKNASSIFKGIDNDLNSKTHTGFSSPSSKKIEINKDKLNSASNIFNIDSNATCNTGSFFSTASGKKVAVNKERMKKASSIFKNIEHDFSSKSGGEFSTTSVKKTDRLKHCETKAVSRLFTSASGKKVEITRDKLENAAASFDDIEETSDISKNELNIFEKHESNVEVSKLTNSSRSDKTALELIEDAVHNYDKALECINSAKKRPIKETTPNRLSAQKKRLGMQMPKSTVISREKLEIAKLLFDNCDNVTDVIPARSVSSFKNTNKTPNRSAQCDFRTPTRPIRLLTSTPTSPTPRSEQSSVANLDFTPIKNVNLLNPVKRTHHYQQNEQSTLVFQEKSCSNFMELQSDIDIEYMHLKKKLEVLEERKKALENQKLIIDRADSQHTRPRLGVLSMQKQGCPERVRLSELTHSADENLKYFYVDDLMHEITLRNAEKMHFSAAKCENKSVIKTLDGAIVIPNTRNTIGVTEISNAFQAMNGIDPKLIPKGWVANHYKMIVWKLASYERKFPQYFKDCLSIENIIQQLKYRYDTEIDKVCRPALRKIMEKDDVSTKRMVLCIADIIQLCNNRFELLLTDGWYAIKTAIDSMLCKQIHMKKLTIGAKIIVQGAELIDCAGCHPLDAPDFVKLKIGYNTSRRVLWHTRLGYCKNPLPFPIHLRTIHPNGGPVAHIKISIVKVYPLRYMEDYNGSKIWRNSKAEEKRDMEFNMERMEEVEKIKLKVYKEYESEVANNKSRDKIDKQFLSSINCSKTLYKLMDSSNDPESVYNLLSSKQKTMVMEYKLNAVSDRQREISTKITKEIEELKLSNRNVTPVLKLLVVDALEESSNFVILNVWRPSDEQLSILKEERCVSVFNVLMKKTNELSTVYKTKFKLHEGKSKKCLRQLIPISVTTDQYYKPLTNEIDTVGLIIDFTINTFEQELWVADFVGRLLYVKIMNGPKLCSLIDNVKIGQSVALCNLIIHLPHKEFGQAVANQFSTISQFPQQEFLQNGLELFTTQLSDVPALVNKCKQKIAVLRSHVNVKPNPSCDLSYLNKSALEPSLVEFMDDEETDKAMSLIDTDQYQ